MLRLLTPNILTDQKYRNKLFRRRCCKRVTLFVIIANVLLYFIVFYFCDLRSPVVTHLTDLSLCPACYGTTVCPELYSNQIFIEPVSYWSWYFNVKNIFYGETKSGRRVVLKMLASDNEFKKFDSELCGIWKLEKNCRPTHLLSKTNVEEQILKLVQYNISEPETGVRHLAIMCPFPTSIFKLVEPIISKKGKKKVDLLNIWTMLKINPEPIIIQNIPKTKGWPVPKFGGVCGRIELVGYEGEPLYKKLDEPWRRRLKYAKQILDAALDFTYKHDRFRFYLLDWSLDNIVVNDQDIISIVDLEDVVILDKYTSPTAALPNWYKTYTNFHNPAFSIYEMCTRHLSDHNLWSACDLLAGDNNILLPVPDAIHTAWPNFEVLLRKCLKEGDRFNTIMDLKKMMPVILNDKSIGHG